MKLFHLIFLLSITNHAELEHLSKNDCLQKIESKAVFEGELRELDWGTCKKMQQYLHDHKINFLKPGNTEIQLDLDHKEQYAVLDFGINHIPKLNRGDTVLIKGYRLSCEENKYLIVTKLDR